ncbi:transporter substrate-binding domain-containing protein [Mesorhizobium sp. Cs1299R1N1]|uniref:substrate-binding periplasmic protein n=1 Tax=Mesorhizobium sp. Cs1299R1N1 TaxID=3015172 RepID=UPI00301BD101
MKRVQRATALTGAICLAASLIGGSAFAECSPKHKFETLHAGQLTVAVTTQPPQSFMTTEGEFGGVESDILKKFAEMECLKISPSLISGNTAVQYIVAGKADLVVGGWYRTEARSKIVGLSYPIYIDRMALYSKSGISTVDDMVGKKIGTVSGYLWVDDLRKLLGDGLALYPDVDNALNDLRAGRIDAVANSYISGVAAIDSGSLAGYKVEVVGADPRVAATVEPAQSAFPYIKSEEALGKALDDDIQEMQRDGSMTETLKSYKLDPSLGDTGAPRLIK